MSFYSEFAPYYEQVFPFREDVYAFLKGYAGVPAGAVLDIGCGPGHYCGRFSRDGFDAVGIDLDSRMIGAAKASYPQASFHCMDMAEAGALRGCFGLAYSIGNVLSHLSPGKLERFIAEVYALLAPGGCWVLQIVNWEGILHRREYLFPVKTLDGGEMTFHRRYSGITPEQVRFTFSLKRGDTAVFSEEITLYPVTSFRCRQLHERAGFQCAGSYGSFGGEAFSGERSAALVMVFRKGKQAISVHGHDPYRCRASLEQAEFPGRGGRDVDNPVSEVRSSIVDAYDNLPPVVEIGYPDRGSEREGAVCGRKVLHAEAFSACGFSSVETMGVIGCPAFRNKHAAAAGNSRT